MHTLLSTRENYFYPIFFPATDKIKLRRMGPKKCVAYSQDIRNVYEILVGNLKERNLLRDLYKEQQQWMLKKNRG